MPKRTWFFILLAVANWASSGSAADDVPLVGDTVVHFASLEEGAAALVADDDFTRSLSRFDLQCRLQTDKDVTLEDWRKFVAAEVRPWKAEEEKPLREAMGRLAPRLAKFKLPLPKTISLVHTTGKEEGNAAYTRASAIIIPDKVIAYAPAQLDRLLVHELFHVLSRNNPALRRDLYAVVGFRPCPSLDLPADLADRRITNPDAPLIDCLIELAEGGRTITGAPVLYANSPQYDAKKGGTLFQYLTFRLLVVEQRGSQWQPRLHEGKSVVVDPKAIPAYFEKIGKNTNYVIHPDEILADNFVHLVLGGKELPTLRIVEDMEKLLVK